MVNSTFFYPSGVGKSSSVLRLGLRRGVFTCVGWKVTLCDPVLQVTPRSCEMEFHYELYSSCRNLTLSIVVVCRWAGHTAADGAASWWRWGAFRCVEKVSCLSFSVRQIPRNQLPTSLYEVCRRHSSTTRHWNCPGPFSLSFGPYSLSTLETIVAVFGDSLTPKTATVAKIRRQSPFSGDYSRQCGQGFSLFVHAVRLSTVGRRAFPVVGAWWYCVKPRNHGKLG